MEYISPTGGSGVGVSPLENHIMVQVTENNIKLKIILILSSTNVLQSLMTDVTTSTLESGLSLDVI